jgi:hypothetical protein
MEGAEASLALARQGVASAWQSVRDAATAELRTRDLRGFVPQLVAAMTSPLQSQCGLYFDASGRLVYRHTLLREGQEFNEVMIRESIFPRSSSSAQWDMAARQATPNGQRQSQAAMLAAQREAAVAQQNGSAEKVNQQIAGLLSAATGQKLVSDPEIWRRWWSTYNEVYTNGDKPVRGRYQRDEIQYAAPIAAGSSPGMSECLAAGTPVWTEYGPLPVEKIQVGDRVLAQDPQRGKVACKAVLRTTFRTPEKLTRLEVGDQTMHSTGGHPFWVAGKAWTKARDLKPGMQLHTASGAVPVQLVAVGGVAATYNLIVADYHTYFVGSSKVLTHDNTIPRPTTALVPGLEEK